MTNLDELIRRADPTRYTEGPRPGSPEAERIWVRVTLMPPAARRGSRRPLLLSVGLVAMALVVVSVVALQIGPGPVSRSVSPAAAALHRIAAAADDQPPVTLSGDQFLESDYQASVLASQSQIGSTTITGAQATIGVTITQFADLLSTSCIHASFSVPTFASAAAQTAWTTAGLLLAPSPATTGSCEVDAGDPTQSRGGAGAINVSGLPGDPATLARDLERGTTGITRIDDPVGADTDVAFERAVLLLVEPVVGATPQFWSALYGAMSMIPGVNLLGTETTHSGTSGLAFSGSNGPSSPSSANTVVVLSPSTGALLEARNIDLNSFLSIYDDLHTSFLPSSEQSQGGSSAAMLEWLDPVGSPHAVNGLPSADGFGPTVTPTALIEVVTKNGTTQAQVRSLTSEFSNLPGVQGMTVTGMSDTGSNGGSRLDIYLIGSQSPDELASDQAQLSANPIVASVRVFTN